MAVINICLVAVQQVSGEEAAQEAEQKIRDLRSQFNQSIAHHDAAGIANYLDSEYQITTSSGEQFQQTPDEEVETWAEIFRNRPDVVYVRTPDVVEVSSYYEMAAESGTWKGQWSSPEGDVQIGGKYFAQWHKADGDWKIRSEIFVGLHCNGTGC